MLHPKADVKNLKQALAQDFDIFYDAQPRVSYSSCQLGYIKSEEGPQDVNAWDEEEHAYRLTSQESLGSRQQSFRYQGHWSWWT